MRVHLLILLAFPCASACGPLADADPVAAPASDTPPEVARPYDEAADAGADIEAALSLARSDRKNVLIVFGGNWCPWCRRLEHTLRNDPAVARALREGFHVVHVDTGARGTGKNAAITGRYGDPQRFGLPVIVVLEPDGRVKLTQATGELESGDRHDPAALLGFLARAR